MNRQRRHIWSEFVPYERLCTREVLAPLAARSIQLQVAVTPDLRAGAARVVAACRDAGVAVALWPMLANTDGRWVSAANADRFCAFVRDAIATVPAPDEVALDLEPPIALTRQLLAGRLPRPPRGVDAVYEIRTLIRELQARGLAVSAAIVPFAVVPPAAASRGWQRALGTPVDPFTRAARDSSGAPPAASPAVSPPAGACSLDRVSTMAYTSLITGYSRRVMRRRDALWLLSALASATRERYRERASISVGTIGIGALGNEHVYASPDQLAEDVAVVRAAGIADIALFNLGGALARPPRAGWLDALVHTEPAACAPPRPYRAALAWHLASAAGRVADRLVAPGARFPT